MKKHKIPVYNGFGKITGAGKIEVTKDDGTKETVNTKNIIIATGSVVKPFPGFETDGDKIVNSDHILELQKVPKSLIVMGAGAVGVEFASVYARFGSETTIVEFMPRLLPIEDEEVSKELERVFKKRGIKSQTNTKLEKLEKTKDGVKVTGTSNGKQVVLEAEMFLVAVGRMPYLEGLGLENTKVEVDKRGTIVVDEFCRTGEPGVFAIGDAIATPWLAHLASKEGIMVVEQIAGQQAEPINMRLVPNCTYCDPEVASVGLTEQKAKEEGYDVKVGKFPFSASGKARILGETDGFVKVVSEKKYDEVLGVHIIGPHATELLAEACVAMRLETTADELGRTIHAHPTVSESIMEAAEGVHNLTIHI
jgi:dihydrolipoamide dehydrogenase